VNGDSDESKREQFRHAVAPQLASPRERIARIRTLVRRGLIYWKGAFAILLLGAAASVGVAMELKPVYRAESTVLVKVRMRMDDRDDSSSPEQIIRQSARLKDMLTTRGRLETAIKRFGLYPETVANRSMLDATEEMKPHVGFRSLEGALFVISFDGERPDTVQAVTAYLSDSLIEDYAAGDLDDVRRDAEFLGAQEHGALAGLEEVTRALTVFLAAHPEFAVEASKSGAGLSGGSTGFAVPSKTPPALGVSAEDATLAALVREHERLQAAAHGGAASVTAASAAANKPLDDQLAVAQAEVEAASRRYVDAQADLASKSNLTEDHPDMRAARMAADAALRQLEDAKAAVAGLEQRKASATPDPAQASPALNAQLRQVDAQIALRRASLARPRPSPGAPAALPPVKDGSDLVELETEWQRLSRAVAESRAHHDDLELRAERARLALEAAHVQANEEMSVVEPPVRPTHPSKGGRTTAALAGFATTSLLALA
jgi:hypothetical protein